MKPVLPAISIDTREQRPWCFPVGVITERVTIQSGDYSLHGLHDRVAIERKEKGDFIACCTHERERFERELVRLSKLDFAVVIVECDLSEILYGIYRSQARPESVLGSVASWMVDYVPFIFTGDRENAVRFAQKLLTKWWQHHALAEAA